MEFWARFPELPLLFPILNGKEAKPLFGRLIFTYLVVKDLQKQKTRKTLALRVHLSLCHSFTRQNGLRGLTRRSSYPNLYESSVLKLSFLNFLSPYNESIPIICSLYYTKNPAKSRSIFNYF